MDGSTFAILDRSMFLTFSLQDRLTLQSSMSVETAQEQAQALVHGLSKP